MLYRQLAEVYDSLGSTTKKIKKARLLASFFEELPAEDLQITVPLLYGRVFPEWDTRELGIAANLLIKAIAKAYGCKEEEIMQSWKKTGDLGDVAEVFAAKKKQSTLFRSALTIKKVIENLQKVSSLEGARSQERKTGMISELLTSASPREAKYVARTVLSDLRIGVAEGIVRDAIAEAFFTKIYWKALIQQPLAKTGEKGERKKYEKLFPKIVGKKVVFEQSFFNEFANEKSMKELQNANNVKILDFDEIKKLHLWKKLGKIDYLFINSAESGAELKAIVFSAIEKAYELKNDYGEVAKLAAASGLEGLQKVSLEAGRPLKVMLAQKTESIETAFKSVGTPAAIEFKYDGFRMQVHKKGDEILIFTRNLENVTKQFPDVVEALKKSIKAKECIIEGEAIGVDIKSGKSLPFQLISQRIKRKYDIEKLAKEVPIYLNLFDLIYLDGKSYLDKPFIDRWKALESIVRDLSKIVSLAEQKITGSEKEADRFYKLALDKGHEGVMFKNVQAPYKPGSRVGYMLKLKPIMETLELAIVGAEWGEGKRSSWLSSFVLACQDSGELKEVGRMATGIKEKTEEGTSFEEMTDILRPLIVQESGKEVKVKPQIVIEVGYEEIQKSNAYGSGYALRFPRLSRLRYDRSVKDIDTLDRVEDLYNKQRGRK